MVGVRNKVMWPTTNMPRRLTWISRFLRLIIKQRGLSWMHPLYNQQRDRLVLHFAASFLELFGAVGMSRFCGIRLEAQSSLERIITQDCTGLSNFSSQRTSRLTEVDGYNLASLYTTLNLWDEIQVVDVGRPVSKIHTLKPSMFV